MCYDYHITSEEILKKTSVHYASSVKAKIAYVLVTYHRLTREEIGSMFNVHPYTIWRYRQQVEDLIKQDPKLEDRLKRYKPSVW